MCNLGLRLWSLHHSGRRVHLPRKAIGLARRLLRRMGRLRLRHWKGVVWTMLRWWPLGRRNRGLAHTVRTSREVLRPSGHLVEGLGWCHQALLCRPRRHHGWVPALLHIAPGIRRCRRCSEVHVHIELRPSGANRRARDAMRYGRLDRLLVLELVGEIHVHRTVRYLRPIGGRELVPAHPARHVRVWLP